MKILFNPIVDFNSIQPYGSRLDYLSDSIFHGLRSLYGDDCYDHGIMEHMYIDNLNNVRNDKCKGFSLYGRTKRSYRKHIIPPTYDIIVCPVHHSKHFDNTFVEDKLKEINKHYRKEQIAILDGNDSEGCNYDWRKYGVLFKRELSDTNAKNGILPISFSIPEEIIVPAVPRKELDFAPLMPCYFNRGMVEQEKTYIYDDEESYFTDYRRSYFAFDSSKGGHDSLRHAEILACGCLPYYSDIENVPTNTMLLYPKDFCKIIKNNGWCIINGNVDTSKPFKPWDVAVTGHKLSSTFDENSYNAIVERMLDYTRKYLTTKATAQYVVNEMKVFI